MKPLLFTFLTFFLTNPAQSEGQASLRIVGRVPSSVSVDIDPEEGILKARSNFPFLMSYKSEGDSETKYIVRMANEAESKLLYKNSPGPLILEIIAP